MEPGMNGQGVINVHRIFFYSYVSKLHPEFTAFFQLPLEKSSGRQTWFVKRPFGKIIWPRKWAKFKKKADLLKVYTKHCLRASSMTFLDISGIQANDICPVSRHRTTDGILPYTNGPTDDKWYKMSAFPHRQSHDEVQKSYITSNELLPASHEGTASCSNVVPAYRKTRHVVSTHSKYQAVTESCDAASHNKYRQVSNIRRTQSRHLKDSHTVLRLSLPNPLKPDVKSRMKMQLEQRRQAMLQLHLSDRQFNCLLSFALY